MRLRRLGGFVGAVVLFSAVSAPPASASNDPFFDRQWALDQIGAPRAWTVTRGAGAVIGIVDSGVEANHPDLAGKVALTADCWNRPACVDGLGNTDADGHGTLIAGVIAAGTDNGKGIAGVAPDARVVVAKVLGPGGGGRAEEINHGIRWVVDHGARVVNISLGDPGAVTSTGGSPLRDGIEYAWSKGAVPVLAAGNYGGVSSENYGALNAIVVGATDRTGALASYSSAIGNAKWGLVAPGGSGAAGPDNNIISTASGGGYASSAGTSMAAPQVAGAVALLLAQGLSPSAAVSKLLATLDRVPCGAGCQGRLNVGVASGAAAAPPTTKAPATAVAAVADTTPPTTEAPAPPETTIPPESTATTVVPAPAAARIAPAEPAGLAAPALGPLSPPPELDPLLASAAVGLVLAVGVAVAGVWAQRRLTPNGP
ncbi:MAG: serine protease [Actinomycetota bacterium]|nr:serine protease [Actinomycetota bacterium]